VPRFLVIAHQTAVSQELLGALRSQADAVPGATFVLLVPATPVQDLIGWEEMAGQGTADADAVSASMAQEAAARLKAEAIALVEARVVDPSPVTAVGDELRLHPAAYAGVIVSTHPPAVSRWLKLDAVSRIRRLTSLPVIHVTAAPVTQSQAPTA
jgi:hypothetical protein